MITIEQLKATQDRLSDLHRYLDIDNKKIQLEEEELRTQAPGFWEDQKAAEAQMKVVKGIRRWIEAYNEAPASNHHSVLTNVLPFVGTGMNVI